MTNQKSPVAVAVEPLRESALQRAEEYARAEVARATELLAAAGFDLNVVAPRPSAMVSRRSYAAAQGRRSFFQSFTRREGGGYSLRLNEPEIVAVDPERVERFVAEAKANAVAQYDAFVAKLEGKVGPVVEAELIGSSVWSHSLLTVTKEGGERETWKTQMIFNISGLGKVFNQWPTRRVNR